MAENLENKALDTEEPVNVPYVVFESAQARLERIIHRLWAVVIALIILLVATNATWLWYESQFEDVVTETYTSETDGGGTAIVNRDGEVHYGESDLHKDEKASP